MTEQEPASHRHDGRGAVTLVISPRVRDLGGFEVRRVLPGSRRRMIGPFIFFDHMGPAEFPPGQGINVRPHPHICLATVTYLFTGEIVHRDSLGYEQVIEPGAVNWMTAGRGIVHSERTAAQRLAGTDHLHGIQAWVALPLEHEETEPSFVHHPADTLPVLEQDGARVRVIAGSVFGRRSPVATLSSMYYAEADIEAGAGLGMPSEFEDRAAYVVDGDVVVGGAAYGAGQLIVFDAGSEVSIGTTGTAKLMLLGGQPLGERHIWWNFVASTQERIEQAKEDWKAGRFAKVPGDESEFIPLPE